MVRSKKTVESAVLTPPKLNKPKLIASICRESFSEFIREFWEVIPGAGNVIWNWHMDVLCNELQTAAERVFAKKMKKYDLLFNIPFGTSKSTICSIAFPAWTWIRMITSRHIIATHTQALIMDFAFKTRAILQSDKFKACFPGILLNRDSGEIYSNTEGGEVRTCTVGGKTPTGFHAHFIDIDDPIDPQGARSEAEIETAAKFLTEVIPSRKVDKQVTLTTMVMQRIEYRDPSAVMLNLAKLEDATPVRHICLPGEITDHISPPELKEFYIDGLLDVNRLSRPVLKDYQVRLGSYAYAGQVLQLPMPPGGGMFKETYFTLRVKAAPYHAKRIRYWDRAATQAGGANTAGVLIAKDEEGRYFVEHVVLGQWEPDERNKVMRATALRDRARYGPNHAPIIYVEAEGGSSGRDAWKAVVRALDGFPVYEDRVTGSKDTRAEPWSCQLAAGNVWLVEDGTWDINGYIQEHCLFKPETTIKRLGKFKDQVDASTGAYNLLIGAKTIGAMRILRNKKKDQNLRIILVSHSLLAATMVEGESLLINLQTAKTPLLTYTKDPNSPPQHNLQNCAGHLTLNFTDINPEEIFPSSETEDNEQMWDTPLPEYGKPITELVMTPEMGKQLWSFILKKNRQFPIRVIVITDDSRAGLSTALALSDCLRLPRTIIYKADNEDWAAKEDEKPPNPYIYAMVKASKHFVIG